MDRLKGKVALVTGAGSGIGKATAIRFAKEGAKVIASTRNSEHGEATLAAIKDGGGEAVFIQTNNRQRDAMRALVTRAQGQWGHLDILVNAAGVLVHKPFLEQTDDDFDLICETNFRAYIWSMQVAIPFMKQQGGGSIVNIASISVMKPELNAYFYGAFKAAVNKLSIDVAKEFAKDRIRINVICPGPVATAMTPKRALEDPELIKHIIENQCIIGRMGQPDDIADLALFLASDEASWITGSTYVADGGVCLT
jgi:NAD(P)-dependent dehydrogenase (short-subunit alcohol dehydrogenase family)